MEPVPARVRRVHGHDDLPRGVVFGGRIAQPLEADRALGARSVVAVGDTRQLLRAQLESAIAPRGQNRARGRGARLAHVAEAQFGKRGQHGDGASSHGLLKMYTS